MYLHHDEPVQVPLSWSFHLQVLHRPQLDRPTAPLHLDEPLRYHQLELHRLACLLLRHLQEPKLCLRSGTCFQQGLARIYAMSTLPRFLRYPIST